MDPEARDGALGVFAQATDPERMRLILERHLQLPGGPPVEVVVCEVAFARRGTSRGLFQYRVTLRDPAGGGHRDEVVTGVAYGGQRTLRAWDKLQRHHRPALADGALVARAAYVPELDLLLQVFPFDHKLPALEPLMAGPWAPLVAPLLTRFGPGDWRLEGWNTEIVRYRVDLRACVRLVVRASEGGTGRTAERRFFAKIYGNASLAHQAWDGQRRLAAALTTDDAALATAPLAAYLQDERVLVQDEVSGACLRELLREEDGAAEAVRRTARALAVLHRLQVGFDAVAAPPQLRVLKRTGPERVHRNAARLRAARPDLAPVVAEVEAGVLSGLASVGEGLAVPVHGDLKLPHVLLDGDRVVLLDFDKFAAGEPMLDVTSLLRKFRQEPQNWQGEHFRSLAHAFVEEYFANAPAAWERRLVPHYASALLAEASAVVKSVRGGRAGSGFRRRGNQANHVGLLLEEAQAVLAGQIS